MDIQKLEIEHNRLLSILKEEKSPRVVLFYLSEFLSKLISINNNSVFESYFIEHLLKYIDLLKSFNPTGIDPKHTEDIIKNAKTLLNLDIFSEYHGSLSIAINKLENKNLIVLKILNGQNIEAVEKYIDTISFPVTEQHPFEDKYFGMIEHVKIILRKGSKKGEDVVTVIPSQESLEKRLSNQISTSWNVAKKFCKEYIDKYYPQHEIIIRFSEKYGNFVGESLGVALTIGFVQELHKLYNLPTDINVNNSAVFTGGVDVGGAVKSVSDRIIGYKTESVFFSDLQLFAIPKNDESAARNKLSELNKKYPNRKLKLIPIEDISDLFNRRDLVNIEKQSLIKRSSKVLKKRGVTITLAIILLGIILFNILKYFDPNPVRIVDENHLVKVENKYGRVLFEKKVEFPFNADTWVATKLSKRRLIDVNNDGTKELLLINEILDGTPEAKKNGRLACFDNKGNLIWEYKFSANIKTPRESFSPQYVFEAILVINNESGKQVIYATSRNIIYYPTAILRLDARTGKKLPGIFWHSGSFVNGIIGDFNEDNKKELVIGGLNNGLERAVIASINLDELKKVRRGPSTYAYSFIGYKLAKFNKYILLPKTDYNSYYKLRYNTYSGLFYNPTNEKFYAVTFEGEIPGDKTNIGYYLDKNLSKPEVLIGDAFQVRRDSLVVHGKLKPPLTNTKEYENILLNQFEEWDAKSGKFVKMVKQ